MSVAHRAATDAERSNNTLDQLCVNTIRTLAMDAVQQANSGHPGTPMALAPVVYCLWQRLLRFDPDHPIWPNRDRFVLSVGHASMLLYSMLHLTGVKAVNPKYETLGQLSVTLDDIKQFRQLGSRCPGHPEYRWTSGVETTSGPLGQGVATSVGMAIAERWLASYFNRPGFDLFDYDVYALCGDGCMMEGISGEAASLAGHLKLAISAGSTTTIRSRSRGTPRWRTAMTSQRAFSGTAGTSRAWAMPTTWRCSSARSGRSRRRPIDRLSSSSIVTSPTAPRTSRIRARRTENRWVRRKSSWPSATTTGQRTRRSSSPMACANISSRAWARAGRPCIEPGGPSSKSTGASIPSSPIRDTGMLRRELPDGWDTGLPVFPADRKGVATRDASGQALNVVARNVPWVLGGSADLGPSCKTRLTFDGAGDFSAEAPAGRNLHFGIREHAMGAILNGLSLSKLRPFGSGFLIFSDYGRAAIRLSALMEIPVIHIFTHDSIGVGEDGPTHQPVEHLASLRAIPGLITLRPADANEAVEAWRVIAQLRHEPVALILTRQAVPTLDRTKYASAEGVRRGAYVLADADDGKPDVLLLATGSEVSLCIEAHEQLENEGIKARVVSMPSWEIFERYCRDHPEYREQVLPESVSARVSVEKASTLGWARYVGTGGHSIGMETFGASAPLAELQKKFGFTPEHILTAARQQIARAR